MATTLETKQCLGEKWGGPGDGGNFYLSKVTKMKQEPIGVGSYASVYEVKVDGTLCAAKEMHPIIVNAYGSEKLKRSFLVECTFSSQILHPNVVQFIGIHYPTPDAKLPWLVMELMHTSVTGLIKMYEQKSFPFHFKLSILLDACQGLQFLHYRNIVHRDLSSNNILLTKHFVAKIGDLGMAKVILPGLKNTQAPGTTVFMAPEALCDNGKYGAPIDVFSVGCVCIHLMSMKWPAPKFYKQKDKSTGKMIILSELERRIEYISTFFTELQVLRNLVENCLEDEPGNRPVISEVIECLRNAGPDQLPHQGDNIIDLFSTITAQEQELKELKESALANNSSPLLLSETLKLKVNN